MWWLVGPIAGMSVVNLLILFVSVKAAFTLKDHVLGFGNLRTLLWLSVVSLPLMGVMWVLAVLAASEHSQLLSLLLSGVVLLHALFCLIGYCIINKRVRETSNAPVCDAWVARFRFWTPPWWLAIAHTT